MNENLEKITKEAVDGAVTEKNAGEAFVKRKRLRPKKQSGPVQGKTVNRIINILLALGCLTVLFPLYMTTIIAFKQPSEMTNDISGALGLPAEWSFENFTEAMRVTDFWHSL